MIYFNEKISPRQMFIMVVMGFAGVSCMFSTDLNIRYAGRYGLFSIGTSVLLAYILVWAVMSLEREKILKFKKILAVAFGIKYSILLVVLSLSMIYLVKKEIIPDVSYLLIAAAVILFVLYVCGGRTEARARLVEVMMYPALVVLAMFFAFGIGKVHPYRLALSGSAQGIGGGTFLGFCGAVVLNLCLFVHPEMAWILVRKSGRSQAEISGKQNKSAKRAILMGVTVTGVLNIITYIETVGTLSVNVVRAKDDSVIRFIKILRMPYVSFERQGGLFIIFFILSMFFSVICVSNYLSYFIRLAGIHSNNIRSFLIAGVLVCGFGVFIRTNSYFGKIGEIHEEKIPIEDRLYTGFLLIDRDEDGYELLMSFKTEYHESRWSRLKIKDFEELKETWRETSDKHLDLSGVKVVMLTERIMSQPQAKREVLSYMERNEELSDNLLLCVTDSNIDAFTGGEKDSKNSDILEQDLGKYVEYIASRNISSGVSKFYRATLVLYGTDKSCRIARFHITGEGIQYAGDRILSVDEVI